MADPAAYSPGSYDPRYYQTWMPAAAAVVVRRNVDRPVSPGAT